MADKIIESFLTEDASSKSFITDTASIEDRDLPNESISLENE